MKLLRFLLKTINTMKRLSQIGLFLIACGVLCGFVGYEVHQQQVQTAQTVAAQLNIRFESVGIATKTKIAGFLSVMLCVAGTSCLLDKKAKEVSSGISS